MSKPAHGRVVVLSGRPHAHVKADVEAASPPVLAAPPVKLAAQALKSSPNSSTAGIPANSKMRPMKAASFTGSNGTVWPTANGGSSVGSFWTRPRLLLVAAAAVIVVLVAGLSAGLASRSAAPSGASSALASGAGSEGSVGGLDGSGAGTPASGGLSGNVTFLASSTPSTSAVATPMRSATLSATAAASASGSASTAATVTKTAAGTASASSVASPTASGSTTAAPSSSPAAPSPSPPAAPSPSSLAVAAVELNAATLLNSFTMFSIGDWGRGGSTPQRDTAAVLGDWVSRYLPGTAGAPPAPAAGTWPPPGANAAADSLVTGVAGSVLSPVAWLNASTLVASTGDNFYDNGVSSASDGQWATSWSSVYTHAALASVPWACVLGNHDWRSVPDAEVLWPGNARWNMPSRNYSVVAPLPPSSSGSRLVRRMEAAGAAAAEEEEKAEEEGQAEASAVEGSRRVLRGSTGGWAAGQPHSRSRALPGTPGGLGPGGSRDCAFLLFIDTMPFISAYRSGPETAAMAATLANSAPDAQLAWIDAELARGTAGCAATIVFGHHPVYSGGEHGNEPDMIARLAPLFEAHGIDGYVAGHEHFLAHLVSPSAGVDYLISGAGSAIRTGWVDTPEARWHAAVNGIFAHSVNGTHVRHSAIIVPGGTVAYSLTRPLKHA